MYGGGYLGSILRVDLTAGLTSRERLPFELATDFLGGAGIAVKLLYDEVAPAASPVGPLNRLILSTGPLAATRIPCTSLMAAAAKSPATGQAAWAVIRGSFPAALKRSGWDVLVIQGQAPCDLQLLLEDGVGAKLLELGPLAGRSDPVPAGGECVFEAGGLGRELGAVMEAKRLRRIVAGGRGAVPVADPPKLEFAAAQMRDQLKGARLSRAMMQDDCGLGRIPASCGRACPAGLPAAERLAAGFRLDLVACMSEGATGRRRRLEDLATATCDCPMMCAHLLDTSLGATVAENTAALVGAVTGMLSTPTQILQVGERVNTLARAFDVRVALAGPRHAEGSPPDYFLGDHNESAREADSGVPSRASLEALGLGRVADDLQAAASGP
jgi:aldehyde:ferredoxin oxidoreductase